jgi:hypothetical protein
MLFYAVLWAMRSNYLFRTWLGYDVWCEPVFFIHSNFIGSNTVTVPISIPISAMDLSQLEVGEFDRVVKRRKRLLEADTTADELNKEKTDTEADELDLGNETDTKADELNKEKTDTETDFGAPTIPRRQTWEYNEACGDCNDAGEPVNELEKYNLLHKGDEFPDTATDELDLENETDTKTDIKADELKRPACYMEPDTPLVEPSVPLDPEPAAAANPREKDLEPAAAANPQETGNGVIKCNACCAKVLLQVVKAGHICFGCRKDMEILSKQSKKDPVDKEILKVAFTDWALKGQLIKDFQERCPFQGSKFKRKKFNFVEWKAEHYDAWMVADAEDAD